MTKEHVMSALSVLPC